MIAPVYVALRGLSKVAALEPAPRGIGTNLHRPGSVETPLMASANPVFVQAHGAEITVDGGYAAHGGVKAITNALDA